MTPKKKLKKPTEKKKKRAKKRTKKSTFWKKNGPLVGIYLLIAVSAYFFIFRDLPFPTRLSDQDYPVSTQILDRNGQLLYEIYTDKKRTPINLEDLPEHLILATIASEDKNFYQHHGLAFQGILRATYNIIFTGSLQSGSTITQQLVKNTLLTPERTIRRKIREVVLSWTTELIYSKDAILEMYLNQVPYGGTAWGIEAAAKMYFDKPASQLNLAESALLAGLPASPTRFSPFGSRPELAKGRQERVLIQMVEAGFINQQELEEANAEELRFASVETSIWAPHFSLWIKEQVADQYGEKMTAQGGLRVTTTLDRELQTKAQKIVADQINDLEKSKVGNGSALIIKPQTGEILAMIGSHDYFDLENDGNVNVVLRHRQPGSSIKPLNYALALETGALTPASVLNDSPTCFQITGQPLYCPVNYDNRFHGPTPLRYALGNSYNIPAVKTLAVNGLAEFVDFATRMGITTFKDPKNYGLSLTLGGGEVTMYDMAQAFSVFANSGRKTNLYAIKEIKTWDGKKIYEHEEEPPPRIISPATAYLISQILLDNNARTAAFGTYSDLVIKDHPEVSVKTGTTNDMKDNWTIGFT
ncbi:penicillin-binding protein, partial [Patescibacteria group bacterium]|nr:penicillin-binding protein [Patescibacteria group bacterium]